MSFLLKIVEGPNKGAEIALVEDVSVTLGKGDDCDIVLADPTLPEAPLEIKASESGVSLNGEALAPFAVKTLGSTSFAVGPSDAQWEELVWPKTSDAGQESGDGQSADANEKAEPAEAAPAKPAAATPDAASDDSTAKESGGSKARHFGCLVAAIVTILVILALGWLFRGRIRSLHDGTVQKWRVLGGGNTAIVEADACASPTFTLERIASRYGLELVNDDAGVRLVGDFATRADRLAATAEAYSAQPGIELDFADAESLKTAIADTLMLVGETKISVTDITNRVAVLSGVATNFRRTLEAIAADVPKIANVDVSGLRVSGLGTLVGMEETDESPDQQTDKPITEQTVNAMPSLPVCGILTAPYPCLVLRDGRRVLEGAPIGDSIVLKIEADSVTLTNSMGRITWKP